MSNAVEPLRVVVTGAGGQIAYSLLYMIAKGDAFGLDQPMTLLLLDLPHVMELLEGIIMELADCALPLLHGVIPTDDPKVAFADVSIAFLIAAVAPTEGMDKNDQLAANVKIFKVHGEALNKYARKDVKVVVVSNPCNTNALICSKYAPSIPKKNFSALSRLDENRAQSHVAAKLQIPVGAVSNVIIWGNHSSTQYPDATNAVITKNGKVIKALDAINDEKWLRETFIDLVQKRGGLIIGTGKMSSAMSAAKATMDHMKDWVLGTPPGKIVSMAVISNGAYGVPIDVMFSFPVTIRNGKWEIVEGLPIDDLSRSMLDATGKELLQEKDHAFRILGLPTSSNKSE